MGIGNWLCPGRPFEPAPLPRAICIGGFRLPSGEVNGESFSFGGRAAALNPSGPSLAVSIPRRRRGGHHPDACEQRRRERPVRDFSAALADPPKAISTTFRPTERMLDCYGNRFTARPSIYYDANNTQRLSYFSRSETRSTELSGWSSVAIGSIRLCRGNDGAVPREWQAALGGPDDGAMLHPDSTALKRPGGVLVRSNEDRCGTSQRDAALLHTRQCDP